MFCPIHALIGNFSFSLVFLNAVFFFFFCFTPPSNALSIVHPLCGIIYIYLLLHCSLSSLNYLPVIRFAQADVLFSLSLLHLFCVFRFKLCVSSLIMLTVIMTMTVKPSVFMAKFVSDFQSFRNASESTL